MDADQGMLYRVGDFAAVIIAQHSGAFIGRFLSGPAVGQETAPGTITAVIRGLRQLLQA